MPRRRLAVAIVPPAPVALEIDALRRALGDSRVARIPAHITLVPPVNVTVDRFDDALHVLRGAAQQVRPFGLRLGPPTTFLPATPVLYLSVSGDLDAFHELREYVFVEPLARPLVWPFVAHCTLLDGAAEERIESAMVALADATFDFHVGAVTLLEEAAGRVWRAIAEFDFTRR